MFQLISYSYIIKTEKDRLIFPNMEQSANSEIGKLAGYGAQLKKWSIQIPQKTLSYNEFCEMLESYEEIFKRNLDNEVVRK